MLNKNIAIAFAVILALVCLAEAREDTDDMTETLKLLQRLDRLYTQASRPRIDRRDVADGGQVDPDLLDRAVRLLQMQNYDRVYSYHTRPRFGKRSDALTNWAKDVEVGFTLHKNVHFNIDKPDLPAWLAYARRR